VTSPARVGTLPAVVVLVTALLGACTLEVSNGDDARGTGEREPSSQGGDGRPAGGPVRLRQSERSSPRSSVSRVVRRVLPSVVNVRVTALNDSVFGGDSARGEGSGVVLSGDGIIVTNAHVVQNALDVNVLVRGEREPLQGEVLGTAPERDLAVIKVDAADLTPITLGRSEGPKGARLGDSVVAIGFPLGLGRGATVTAGIVSAKHRTIQVGDPSGGPTRLEGMLQTDAAINPGNSGGALVDLSGQLIGINSAAASAGAAENVGFAIAVDDALPVIREILSEPLEDRAWLGVQVVPLDDTVASQLGLPPGTRGAAIGGVIPGSPAEEAGIREGEVIVEVDGDSIGSANDLTETLTRRGPGEEVDVTLVSSEGRRSVTLELAQRPPAFRR
jgi:S1-C subfamily serine protease